MDHASRLEVHTLRGDTYVLPLVHASSVLALIPEGEFPESQESFSVVDVSQAFLSVPTRIIRYIKLGGKTVWVSTA